MTLEIDFGYGQKENPGWKLSTLFARQIDDKKRLCNNQTRQDLHPDHDPVNAMSRDL